MMIMVKHVFLFVNYEALVISNSKAGKLCKATFSRGKKGTHLGAGVDINILTSD